MESNLSVHIEQQQRSNKQFAFVFAQCNEPLDWEWVCMEGN